MNPVIVLVGRPNVGKSTLFNRLTRSRDALVADLSGLTRDRNYGKGRIGDKPYLVVDTGGFDPVAKDGILYEIAHQTRQAVKEATIVLFIVDGRKGLSQQDKLIADYLRKTGQSIFLIANKAEGMKYTTVSSDFYELGFGAPRAISAVHGDAVTDMINEVLDLVYVFQKNELCNNQATHGIKVAIVGRPNVGKSTLVNGLIRRDRVITFDIPGTTRDSIYIDFEYNGNFYTLIDTAGLRKQSKVSSVIEKFSMIKTIQSISDANVVILMLDARQDISDQDAHIADLIMEHGRALVVGVNKWDGLDSNIRERIKLNLTKKLKFLSFAKFHFVSATEMTGVSFLMNSVNDAYIAGMAKLSTPKLTRALIEAVKFQKPRRCGMIQPKLRYAHQGGQNPPIIVIHGNAINLVTKVYKRYLENRFRETFCLIGTPLRIELRSSSNPYVGKF
ncbi:MAG: ribosome biogenesis GTPase Der [Burkholderia sp.]|nr:ribosome biogenesis GTPase Der [Burkholderia sp.]